MRSAHGASGCLLIEMKSGPKKTVLTPGRWNSRSASGEAAELPASRNSCVPDVDTGEPGMNLSESVLGVVSVWMNIERRAAGGRTSAVLVDSPG